MTLFAAKTKRQAEKAEPQTKTRRKLTRAERKQIEAAIARANRTDKKEQSAQDSIPYERMWPDGMNAMTFEETNLLCIYNPGSRLGAIEALSEMRGHLEPDETELLALTNSTLAKLRVMTDTEFDELELYPDFDE